MAVSIDSKIAKDLIETKLKVLTEKINAILKKWNVNSKQDLLEGAKTGRLTEAEDDAIELQNLFDKRTQIEQLLTNLF